MPKSINELNADLFRERKAEREAEREADPKAARIKAMDYLARREYGQAELAGRLIAAGFLPDLAQDVVASLTEEGLQDDRRFAESFLAARVGRGSGPLRIRQALKERGIAAAMVDDVLADADIDWFELALQARHKKYGSDIPGDFKEKARQMRFLQYRGFDIDQIQDAMTRAGD